jgi:hypothetical protein
MNIFLFQVCFATDFSFSRFLAFSLELFIMTLYGHLFEACGIRKKSSLVTVYKNELSLISTSSSQLSHGTRSLCKIFTAFPFHLTSCINLSHV